ncbi:GT-D fold domain-containing glycosyltransferase [Flavobacterium sp.]|uniref:GT-D fold domain-containing glycosyltransferase n=1 Tax=Flavobacterium sp. TaxID=239 RepID=UPI0026225F2A|nr:GT-D fold domain-containing glycosyltransferase [Flavobacterium sp.]
MNLRYGNAFKAVRKVAKYTLSAMYPMVVRICPLPKVMSIPETLEKINSDKSSIARFGDQEFLYFLDKLNLPFQKYDERLANMMKEILMSEEPNILVGLPIGYYSLENLSKRTTRFWRCQIAWVYPRLRKHLRPGKVYANASMTRLYMDYEDKSKSGGYFEMVRKIWDGRDVLLLEGEKSRLGVGNTLFDNATSLQRILGPAQHAFSRFDDLLASAKQHSKDKLILVAMGPTAKPLAFELAKAGYQAVDIGNLDIEYEWYLRGATSKVVIPGKYTSEAVGGRNVADINNEKYNAQIIDRKL